MAFENFFRKDRERYGSDRNPERSRQGWRDENRGESPDRGYGLGSDEDQRRGWREGSDYYGNRDERYGSERYGRETLGQRDYSDQDYGRRARSEWRDEGQRYGAGLGGRWQGDYGSSYTSNYGRGEEESRGSFGGYGRDRDYGQFGGQTGSSSFGGREQYRGRGPRGYRRSDERIREDICDMLTDDPYLDASNLEVTVKECEVTISGTVNSREDKRRAEDLVEGISGVKDVHNTLRVSNEQRGVEQRSAGTEGQGTGGQSARH